MEKRVKRSEVNITIGSKSPVKSPLKDSLFPDANSLAQKYGVQEKEEAAQPPPQAATVQTQRADVELLRKLEEKNKKIDQLCTLLEALEPAPGVDPERIQKLLDEGVVDENVDFRDAKIVSLAKKSHRLTMQLNKEKSVTDKLNQQVQELQKTVLSLNQELQTAKASAGKLDSAKVYNRNLQGSSEPTADDYQATIAGLNRDIKESAKQAEELKRKLAQSVDENKQLSRALSREVGEGVSLEQAVSGGWRGRAQQIIMLKAKIKKMEAGEGMGSYAPGAGADGGTVASYATHGTYGTRAGSAPAGGDVDRKAGEDLAAMSSDRRQIVEALTEERAGLMDANQQLEKKNNAQKARIHNLEADTRKLKDSLQMVLDKSGTDDQLLDALRGEISRLKTQLQQSQQQAAAAQSVAHSGRSMADGITSRFSHAGTAALGADKSRQGTLAGSAMMADSLDFLQVQQQQQQEQWENELRQLQGEVQRLRRLCKNQSDQLETQDGTIRQLKKKLNTDFQS